MDAPPVLVSPLLASLAGVRHGFLTRRGGISSGPYSSLNVGLGSADEAWRVAENRRRAAALFGEEALCLNTAYQTHSAIALVATGAWSGERPKGDAVVSATPGVLCGVLSADCAPVLIADAQGGVAAAVHAGWRGALEGVIEAAVAAMTGLGAAPGRMAAAIGPCIGPRSYEVGLEFLERFEARVADAGQFFRPGERSDKRLFDLPAFVAFRLGESGVERCQWIGRDTLAEEDDFFSCRRAQLRGEGDYGRLLSVIAISGPPPSPRRR